MRIQGPPENERRALEMLLEFTAPEVDVRLAADSLIAKFGTLDAVLAAPSDELNQLSTVTTTSIVLLKLVDWIRSKRDSAVPALLDEHFAALDRQRSVAREFQVPLFPDASSAPQLELTLPPAQEEKTPSSVRAIQDVLLVEGAFAVKLATHSHSLEQLQEALVGQLSQNSVETRRRYVQSITRWFFSDGVEGILRKAWVAYEDEAIETDLLRWSYLKQEAVMGAAVAEALFPLENGITIPATYFDKFLADHLSDVPPEKTRERLKTNLKKLGFLDRSRSKGDRLNPVTPQKTSFLILLHYLFASKSVRTIELRHLLENPFWKFLGYKSEDAVRSVLREADAAGTIGKYIVADELEQITTCLSLSELLNKKVRL